MGKICSKCGIENRVEAKFCYNCANMLDTVSKVNENNNDSNNEINFSSMINNIEKDNNINDEKPIQFVENNESIENVNSNNINDEKPIQFVENNESIENVNSNNINDEKTIQFVENSESIENVNSNNINENNINNIDKDFYGNDFNNKKSHKWIVILIIIVLLLGLGFGYLFLTKPKNMLIFSMNNYFSKLSKNTNIKFDFDSVSTIYELDFNINDKNSNNDVNYNFLNKLKINGKLEMDIDKNIANIDVGSTYDDKELIKGSVYSDNSQIYMFFDGIYDKYIKINDIEELEKINKDDYANVFNGLKNALINSLKEEYFTKSSEKININNKEINVNEIVLKINNDNYSVICKDIVNTLKYDQKFIDSYKNITGEDVVEKLNKYDDFNEKIGEEVSIYFYTKKYSNKLIKISLNKNLEFVFDEKEIEMSANDSENKENSFLVKINYDNNIFKISYDVKDLTLVINLRVVNEYNKIVMNKDVSNAINYNELSDEDVLKIAEALYKNDGLNQFQNEIRKSFNAFDSNGYYYNYDVYNNYNYSTNNEF